MERSERIDSLSIPRNPLSVDRTAGGSQYNIADCRIEHVVEQPVVWNLFHDVRL